MRSSLPLDIHPRAFESLCPIHVQRTHMPTHFLSSRKFIAFAPCIAAWHSFGCTLEGLTTSSLRGYHHFSSNTALGADCTAVCVHSIHLLTLAGLCTSGPPRGQTQVRVGPTTVRFSTTYPHTTLLCTLAHQTTIRDLRRHPPQSGAASFGNTMGMFFLAIARSSFSPPNVQLLSGSWGNQAHSTGSPPQRTMRTSSATVSPITTPASRLCKSGGL